MNFALSFLRHSSATGAPQLGGDSDPTTAYGTPGAPPGSYKALTLNRDNILMTRHCSKNGQPYRRVAIAATGPSGANARTATLYVWDGLTGHWYLAGMAKSGLSLVYNTVTLVTIPTLGEVVASSTAGGPQGQEQARLPPGITAGASAAADPGGLALMLCVDANGTPTAGMYQFSMSPCFSANIT